MRQIAQTLARFRRDDAGMSTVEYVIGFPVVLALTLAGVDFGTAMIRHASLDRAVEMAVREVRLGNVAADGSGALKDTICALTFMIRDCRNSITIDMRPVDIGQSGAIELPDTCLDREAEIQPFLSFDPGAGNQEMMMVQVCVIAAPFLNISAFATGMILNEHGEYALVTRSAFANEPR